MKGRILWAWLLGLGWVVSVWGQAKAPERKTGATATFDLPGGAKLEMVWVPAGTFVMGSPDTEPGQDDHDEGPLHSVTITKGFWLGKVELTQGQWMSAMGTRPWAGMSHVQENVNHPAVYISWDEVQALVGRLNRAEGKRVYRLPTEAEWEYACRAGTTTAWSFGSEEIQLKDYAWYTANARDMGEQCAQAAGTRLANPWGLHDMHGNVWEWVQDGYGSYSSKAQTDPTGAATGSYRVHRGGGFLHIARGTRSANRGKGSPDARIGDVGVRLVRQEPQEP